MRARQREEEGGGGGRGRGRRVGRGKQEKGGSPGIPLGILSAARESRPPPTPWGEASPFPGCDLLIACGKEESGP